MFTKTQKIMLLFISFLILILATLCMDFYKAEKSMKTLKELSLQIVKNHYVDKEITNPKIIVRNNKIHIQVDLYSNFDSLKLMHQFAQFELFSKQLRFALSNHIPDSRLYSSDITITASTNQQIFNYSSILPNDNFIFNAESNLTINQEIMYTSCEFKKQYEYILTLYPNEKVNGYDDLEIFNYSKKFFNMLTNRGKYYNPKTDQPLIEAAITDKFGITMEEFTRIYNKYYLIPH